MNEAVSKTIIYFPLVHFIHLQLERWFLFQGTLIQYK